VVNEPSLPRVRTSATFARYSLLLHAETVGLQSSAFTTQSGANSPRPFGSAIRSTSAEIPPPSIWSMPSPLCDDYLSKGFSSTFSLFSSATILSLISFSHDGSHLLGPTGAGDLRYSILAVSRDRNCKRPACRAPGSVRSRPLILCRDPSLPFLGNLMVYSPLISTFLIAKPRLRHQIFSMKCCL